jgi:hypothetical protein
MSNNQSANAELTVDVILMSSDFPLLPFTYFDSHFDILNHILLVQIIFIYMSRSVVTRGISRSDYYYPLLFLGLD